MQQVKNSAFFGAARLATTIYTACVARTALRDSILSSHDYFVGFRVVALPPRE